MRIILLSIASIFLLSSCGEKVQHQKSKDFDKETVPVQLLPIKSNTDLQVVNTSGTLSTENEAHLSFKIGGIIENIAVKEGDRVRKGQLLASLKSAEIRAQSQQAQLSFEKAQRDFQRATNLYRDSVMTLEQMQNTKTGLDIARQTLDQVLFNQQYAKIYSPADGFVVNKKANTGELISAGSIVIVVNASSSSSKWILKTGLSDQDWAAVERGNKAMVSIDAFPGKKFSAVVSRKALAADANSGSFVIDLQVDFTKEQPAIGMFGTASITPSKPLSSFNIPYEALLEANGRKGFVFVSDDRRTVKKVQVTISNITNNTVSVLEGLEGHAFLVTSGSPYLKDNSFITAL